MSGKLVKSAWATGNGLLVEDSLVEPGVEVTIAIANARGHRGAQATVNRADLLTAVARKRNRPTIVETQIEHWKERAQKAEAAIDRVKAVIEPSSWVDCADVWIAIDGLEPFELPTKAWSGIVATHPQLGEIELRLFPTGEWVSADVQHYLRWKPDAVLEHFTGHRLVED